MPRPHKSPYPPKQDPQPPWWDRATLKALGLILFAAGIFPVFPPYQEDANLYLVLAGFVFAGGREAVVLLQGFLKAMSGGQE